MELLRSSATGMTFFWIQAVIAALVLSVVTWYLGRRKQFGNQLFPVSIGASGHAMEIRGTGTVGISCVIRTITGRCAS